MEFRKRLPINQNPLNGSLRYDRTQRIKTTIDFGSVHVSRKLASSREG